MKAPTISSMSRRSCLWVLLCAISIVGFAQCAAATLPSAPSQEPLQVEPPLGHQSTWTPYVAHPPGEQPMEFELSGAGEAAAPPAWFPFAYNLPQSSLSWLVGDGDEFGMLSVESFPTLAPNANTGIVLGMGFHFLGGPIEPDMPPRLFDFQIGLQHRKPVQETFGYDVGARVGFFSDFEGSARKGVRFPGHAVGYFRWSPAIDLALGIDYLDRDDISLLPVVGVILLPRENVRLELVFPRPRAEVWINPTNSLYIAGELGGGTWAIERAIATNDKANDVVTYRDFRLLFGLSSRDDEGSVSGLELGYVFGRDLSYRTGDDFSPVNTLLVRMTHRF